MFLLAACDPGVRIAWEKDFSGPVSINCIEGVLHVVAPNTSKRTYVSEGERGFPAGTVVTQFSYSNSERLGTYNLDVAKLPNGTTHYYHEWAKLGTRIEDDERSRVFPLLKRANDEISRRCDLSFSGIELQEGPG
jgi:hypothetical protein